MQAVLVMFRADGERRSFSIARDMTVIGRREDCDLRIPLGDVSRKHCRLVRDGDVLKVEDLGSSNGTFLNGQRVQEALLSPGDSIQVGPVVFVLQVDGEPADDELSPVVMEPAAADVGSGSLDSDDSGPLHPTSASEAGDDEEQGDLEELDALEEVHENQHAAAGSEAGIEAAAERTEDEDELQELEPLEELDPLEPDFTDDDSVESERK